MSLMRFRIEHPNGAVENLVVEGDRALIGSAAHCELRLPLQAAQPEHVELRQQLGSIWAKSLSFQPPPLLNDASFGEAPVATGSSLRVGPIRIWVSLDEQGADGVRVKSSQRKTSPVVLVGGPLMMIGLLSVVLRDIGGTSISRGPPEAPPALWGDPVTACPRPDPRQATALASEKLILARSKRERRPFSARDGVAAVPLFEEAEACFRTAGDAEMATNAKEAAQRLRTEINLDYRTHQVRLDHALSIEDWATAFREMEALLALTEGKSGAYVSWLSIQHRALRIQIDQARKEK